MPEVLRPLYESSIVLAQKTTLAVSFFPTLFVIDSSRNLLQKNAHSHWFYLIMETEIILQISPTLNGIVIVDHDTAIYVTNIFTLLPNCAALFRLYAI